MFLDFCAFIKKKPNTKYLNLESQDGYLKWWGHVKMAALRTCKCRLFSHQHKSCLAAESFPAKALHKKGKAPKLTLPYESLGIETRESNLLFCPPLYTYSLNSEKKHQRKVAGYMFASSSESQMKYKMWPHLSPHPLAWAKKKKNLSWRFCKLVGMCANLARE